MKLGTLAGMPFSLFFSNLIIFFIPTKLLFLFYPYPQIPKDGNGDPIPDSPRGIPLLGDGDGVKYAPTGI